MEKEYKSVVKKALYAYPKAMAGAVISTVEWAESNMAVDYGKVCVQTSPSNYKEAQLCKLIDENTASLRWCYVIEKVLEHYQFEQEKVKFIQKFFFEKKSEAFTCLSVGVSRRTFFRWKEEILETAYKWAVELKVL